MMALDNDTLVRVFVEAFNTKDARRLAPYLHPDVVFRLHGDNEGHTGTRSFTCGTALHIAGVAALDRVGIRTAGPPVLR